VVYGFSAAHGAAPASDDENVIMKLAFPDACASTQPDAYNDVTVETLPTRRCQLTGASADFTPDDAADVGVPVHAAAPAPATGPKVVRLLTEFEEKSKSGEWPNGTNVHCYWCCHKFGGTPVGLPVKLAEHPSSAYQFHVVGCFCSLACAAAYNFSGKESVDECMNRHTLINLLSHSLGLGQNVRAAPERSALTMFGGHLSIEEFREFTASGRYIMVNSPPMIAVTQQLEEVHDNDIRSEYKYIPIDNDRITKYQEKLRLKRSKPLIDFKNTLDHTMKLKYTT
jgi:hypothetical protein